MRESRWWWRRERVNEKYLPTRTFTTPDTPCGKLEKLSVSPYHCMLLYLTCQNRTKRIPHRLKDLYNLLEDPPRKCGLAGAFLYCQEYKPRSVWTICSFISASSDLECILLPRIWTSLWTDLWTGLWDKSSSVTISWTVTFGYLGVLPSSSWPTQPGLGITGALVPSCEPGSGMVPLPSWKMPLQGQPQRYFWMNHTATPRLHYTPLDHSFILGSYPSFVSLERPVSKSRGYKYVSGCLGGLSMVENALDAHIISESQHSCVQPVSISLVVIRKDGRPKNWGIYTIFRVMTEASNRILICLTAIVLGIYYFQYSLLYARTLYDPEASSSTLSSAERNQVSPQFAHPFDLLTQTIPGLHNHYSISKCAGGRAQVTVLLTRPYSLIRRSASHHYLNGMDLWQLIGFQAR